MNRRLFSIAAAVLVGGTAPPVPATVDPSAYTRIAGLDYTPSTSKYPHSDLGDLYLPTSPACWTNPAGACETPAILMPYREFQFCVGGIPGLLNLEDWATLWSYAGFIVLVAGMHNPDQDPCSTKTQPPWPFVQAVQYATRWLRATGQVIPSMRMSNEAIFAFAGSYNGYEAAIAGFDGWGGIKPGSYAGYFPGESVAIKGIVTLYAPDRGSDGRWSDLIGPQSPPAAFVAGTQDCSVPISIAENAVTRLKSNGVHAVTFTYAGGHDFTAPGANCADQPRLPLAVDHQIIWQAILWTAGQAAITWPAP